MRFHFVISDVHELLTIVTIVRQGTYCWFSVARKRGHTAGKNNNFFPNLNEESVKFPTRGESFCSCPLTSMAEVKSA